MPHKDLYIIDKLLLETKYEKIKKSKRPNLMHYHNAYEIMFLIKSENSLFIKDSCYQLGSNKLVFIGPYTIHTIIYNDNTEYQRIVLNFEKDFVEDILKFCNCPEVLNIFHMYQDQDAVNIVDLDFQGFNKVNKLFVELNKKYSVYMEKRDNLSLANLKLALVCCLLELYNAFRFKPVKSVDIIQNETVNKIIHFLDENYKENISLEMLEEEFYVSRFYICRVFKKVTGSSVIEYLQCRRIIEAQRMLIDSNMPITDICYECGFNNIQHFYRVFKKNTDTTPRIWFAKRGLP